MGKKTPAESVRLAECIGEVRALLHQILSDTVPLNTKSKGKTRLSKSKFMCNRVFYFKYCFSFL